MNVEIFIRNVQLAKLGIAEFNSDEKKTYEFLIDNLSELNTYISYEKPNRLYFGKVPDKIVLEYDLEDEQLWVEYHIWKYLIYKHIDIKPLLKWWVKNTLGLNPKHIDNNDYDEEEVVLYLKSN